jgi:hypothetical protein
MIIKRFLRILLRRRDGGAGKRGISSYACPNGRFP